MIATAIQGDTLDLVCWRELGATANLVEQALDLNPGIAGSASIAPGTQVTLPDALPPAATPVLDLVQLWN